MVSTQKRITYFDSSGVQNTDETLKLARERADELGIKEVIVASTRGDTGVKASNIFKGFNLVVIPHATGWKDPGIQEMSPEKRRKIEENGGKVFTSTGIDITDKIKTSPPYFRYPELSKNLS